MAYKKIFTFNLWSWMNTQNLIKKLPFSQHRWFQFLGFLIKNFIQDDCQQKSASLTYTTLLSIVPILTVLLVMLSSVPALSEAKEQIQGMIYQNLLPSSSLQVSQYFNEFAEKSSNLTAIGVIMLFVTTIMTLTTIENAFNQIWRVTKKEAGMVNILRYWAIITLGPLVLGTAFIISSAVQSLSFLNKQIAGYGIDWVLWVQFATFITMTLGFVAMYWFIPRCKVKFLYALIAGVVVSVLFEVLKQTFGMVMSNFTSYQTVYGAFAVLPIFLMWIYLSWNVILLGVEISYSLTIFSTKEVAPRHALLSVLEMLNLLYQKNLKGETVCEIELRNVLGRHEMPNWYQYIHILQNNNLITTTNDGCYVLKRPLTHYTFWNFYENLPFALPHQKDLQYLENTYLSHEVWLKNLADKLILNEQKIKQNFNIPLSDIFEANEHPSDHAESQNFHANVNSPTQNHKTFDDTKPSFWQNWRNKNRQQPNIINEQDNPNE